MGAQDAKLPQFCTELRCGSKEHGPRARKNMKIQNIGNTKNATHAKLEACFLGKFTFLQELGLTFWETRSCDTESEE